MATPDGFGIWSPEWFMILGATRSDPPIGRWDFAMI
jgi:hypothetical protein